MSTTTVSFSSTSRDAELEALRRREAEAREALRRRIGGANAAITAQEAHFQSLVSRLDKSASRLPDLALSAPQLPAMSSGMAQDPAKLEAYATRLKAEVDTFSRRLDAAIAEAERLLDRRLKKAAAWRNATDLVQQVELLVQRCREAAARLQEDFTVAAAPAQLDREAELETVQAYGAALTRRLDEVRQRHVSLRARVQTRENAIALSGSIATTHAADEALSRHQSEQRERAVAALRLHQDTELARHDLKRSELPGALSAQLEAALEQAHTEDWRESITRWFAREKQQSDGVAQALRLLQCAPDLVSDDVLLSRRWASLAAQLQRIAGKLEDFTPSVEREHEQLHADARRLVNTAFTKADWVRAMREQGFEVLEGEDGQGLVVVDLDHPECWLEATPLASEDGGFGAALELKTDANALADEGGLTDTICARLARVAGGAGVDVSTEAEVIERKRRIERARRPQALAQRL